MRFSHQHGNEAQPPSRKPIVGGAFLSVYGSPVAILAQKAAFCTKQQLPDASQAQQGP
jgi:hypothetical protein